MRSTAAGIVIAAFALLMGCGRAEDKTAAAAPPVQTKAGVVTLPADSPKLKQLKVETVVEAEVPTGVVEAPGKIEINPNRVSHISAPVAGRIVSVAVRLGDAVREGDVVFTIESPEADAALSGYLQAESALGQLRSAAIKAQSDVDRLKDLLEHQAIARKDLLNAEQAQVQANASVQQAEAVRQQALRRLEIYGLKPGQFGQRIVVHAPVAGKVLELNAVPGEFRNDTTASLVTIADLSSVWVSSDVPETSIRFIKLDERIELELSAYPDEKFRARVMRIADTVDPVTRAIKVRAQLENPDGRLRPEMFGRIRHTEGVALLPMVPASALIQSEGLSYVWKATAPGTFERTQVTAGNRTGDRIAISQGLKAGDRIVTDGVMLLRSM